MRKEIFVFVFTVLTFSLSAQLKFDLGLKGGVNFSKISFDVDDYTAESVTKTHFGAFGRIGWDRVFIQPELYFSGKGGSVDSDLLTTVNNFNFNTFDIPLLLGLRAIKGKVFDFQLVAGPVFSNITSSEVSSDEIFDSTFYSNHYFGFQYGIGIDVLFLTLHARMENGLGDFYSQAEKSGKNNTFMVSLGFKFL
ncbi:MAG: PorT family protein [Bacteroidetes bacterium]|nr:MAG: PorT family protein [Bacteroidota bacterium]